MNVLEEDNLKSLLETLKMAQKVGFSSSSSPIGWFLEVGTDICLRLSILFKRGVAEARKNPEIKFNYRVSDSLGNPKSFKIFEDPKIYWDPKLSEIFKELASFFILVKRADPKALDLISKLQGTQITTSEENQEQDKETRIQIDIAKVANVAYHRRQKKKRSHSKHSQG